MAEKLIFIVRGKDGQLHEMPYEYRLPRHIPVLGGIGALEISKASQKAVEQQRLIDLGYSIERIEPSGFVDRNHRPKRSGRLHG